MNEAKFLAFVLVVYGGHVVLGLFFADLPEYGDLGYADVLGLRAVQAKNVVDVTLPWTTLKYFGVWIQVLTWDFPALRSGIGATYRIFMLLGFGVAMAWLFYKHILPTLMGGVSSVFRLFAK